MIFTSFLTIFVEKWEYFARCRLLLGREQEAVCHRRGIGDYRSPVLRPWCICLSVTEGHTARGCFSGGAGDVTMLTPNC